MRIHRFPGKLLSFRGASSLGAFLLISATVLTSTQIAAAQAPPSPAQAIRNNFTDVHRRLLEMAIDFPADKYDFTPQKGVRSFGEVILHATSGLVYAAKKGRGEDVKWDEPNTGLKGKAAIVAYIQKWNGEANASLKAAPDASFTKTLSPWLEVLEHSAEHYGQLVAYYRMNGIVPPESRPKK